MNLDRIVQTTRIETDQSKNRPAKLLRFDFTANFDQHDDGGGDGLRSLPVDDETVATGGS